MSGKWCCFVLVAVIGPPACFALGKGYGPTPLGFLYVWGCIALCAAVQVAWGHRPADGMPRAKLRRPPAQPLKRVS